MDTEQIHEALETIFSEPNTRIVFWNDPGAEFQGDLLPALPAGVELIRLNETSGLEVKLRIEHLQPDTPFLLYSSTEEPPFEDDWLLDIRLYGRSFRADRASLLLNELGLRSQSLREYLAERRKFFENKERTQKLRALASPEDDRAALDLKMLTVVVRAEQPDFLSVVRTLFHGFIERGIDPEGEDHLGTPPSAWKEIERLDLATPFWSMVESTFGYREEPPTLRNLLIRLLVSDYAHHLRRNPPQALNHLLLPSPGPTNAVVCLAAWRDSNRLSRSYDILSNDVAEIIHLKNHLDGVEIEEMLDVMTFFEVERAIARCLRDRVETTADAIDNAMVREIAIRRRAGHWASPPLPDRADIPRKGIYTVHAALMAAADFFALRNHYRPDFARETAAEMYGAYENELYRFDQLYRHFCEAADLAQEIGWDILKSLRNKMEMSYENDYLRPLALSWGKFIGPNETAGLIARWEIASIPNQYRFFEHHVAPRLEEGENRKVFVIISDAFRYEAARELADALNGKYRIRAEISSQLGVLPSYTTLGMASLLPHASLVYRPDGTMLVDGRPVSTLEQRNELLKRIDGLACKSDMLMQMKKEEGRALTNGKRVVYIYHDTIDAIGDKAPTEEKTFMAVRTAIDELAALVRYVINNLNGNHIVVTADHGFHFTENPPGEVDKNKLAEKPPGTVTSKKRYLIGRGLSENDSVWHGHTSVTAGTDDDMEFWIPRGISRFHFSGGARFVHGGAMLQEIVVPVITIRQVKEKDALSRTRPKQVRVQVLGTNHRITTGRYRFELLQTDPVSERVRPVTLKVAVYEGEEPVTDIVAVTFDSISTNIDERRRWVPLTLREREYDKKTRYRLSLRDADTGIELQNVDVIIDRAFTDDF